MRALLCLITAALCLTGCAVSTMHEAISDTKDGGYRMTYRDCTYIAPSLQDVRPRRAYLDCDATTATASPLTASRAAPELGNGH